MAHASTSISRFDISTIVRSSLLLPALRAGTCAALAVAPGWLARNAARRFITPPRHAHTAPERLLLESTQRLSIATPTGQLAAWQFGDRGHPAVIVSHGWGGRGAQFREFVPALLAAGFQVWLFDHVSHGLSEGHEAPITDLAQGLTRIVRAAEADGATVAGLIGHSLGSAAIGIALRNELKDQFPSGASDRPAELRMPTIAQACTAFLCQRALPLIHNVTTRTKEPASCLAAAAR